MTTRRQVDLGVASSRKEMPEVECTVDEGHDHVKGQLGRSDIPRRHPTPSLVHSESASSVHKGRGWGSECSAERDGCSAGRVWAVGLD
jgi:hypothetical protein